MKALVIAALLVTSSVVFAQEETQTTTVSGDKAALLASALMAGNVAQYKQDKKDESKGSITTGAIGCDFSYFVHPTESSVIDSASCMSGKKTVTAGVALVIALKAAGIEESSNNGPSAANPWMSTYDIKSIKCSGLRQPEEASCTVTMTVSDEE